MTDYQLPITKKPSLQVECAECGNYSMCIQKIREFPPTLPPAFPAQEQLSTTEI